MADCVKRVSTVSHNDQKEAKAETKSAQGTKDRDALRKSESGPANTSLGSWNEEMKSKIAASQAARKSGTNTILADIDALHSVPAGEDDAYLSAMRKLAEDIQATGDANQKAIQDLVDKSSEQPVYDDYDPE